MAWVTALSLIAVAIVQRAYLDAGTLMGYEILPL